MVGEPSDDDVNQLVAICDCDPDTARRYLKVKNNNIEAALNAIFDNEDISQAEKDMNWTEGDFTADREGNAQYGPLQNPAYNENSLYPLGSSAAPTRGSSPVPSLKRPTTRAEEDAEMQQALINSRHDLRSDEQETGVISSLGTNTNSSFRPATRSSYEPNQWAMTMSSSAEVHQTTEIIPDMDPAERQNVEGEPRFLKHLPSGDYLPNLLSICHTIPLARKTLLLTEKLRHSYGSDSEWWKGHDIRLPRIVSTADLSLAEPAASKSDDVIAEMQRLMAFHDGSKRSYASAEPLARVCAMKQREGASDALPSILLDQAVRAWELSASEKVPAAADNLTIFHTIIGTSSAEGLHTPDMWSMPLFVSANEDQKTTLAELMDGMLWDMDTDDSTITDNYMERCADVLAIRVSHRFADRQRLDLVVPDSFFVDKYLKENVDVTREVRNNMAQSKRKIETIENVQSKLNTFGGTSTSHTASDLMGHVIGYFSGENRKAIIEEKDMRGFDVGGDLPPAPEGHAAIAEQLAAVYRSIEDKLQVLEKEKENARQMLNQLSQTAPLENLRHRYSLRGVDTKPNVTYLLRPKVEKDGDDQAMLDDDDAPEGMQWWRIEYDVQVNGAKVMKTKSTQDDVLRAVELEHNQALLVYASDQAVSTEHNIGLPEELDMFIEDDDEFFVHELQDFSTSHSYNTAGRNSPPAYDQPRPSIESTTAQYDYHEGVEPPPYDDAQNINISFDEGKDEVMGDDIFVPPQSPPVHEITHDEDDSDDEGDMEMVQMARSSKASVPRGGSEPKAADSVQSAPSSQHK